MSSWNRRVWILALVSAGACSGESSPPSAPSQSSNGSATLPSAFPLMPGALELWPGGPQLRNTASTRALKARYRLQPMRPAIHQVSEMTGLALASASPVELEVLGEGMTQADGVVVGDISPDGVAVGRAGPRAATWAPASVSPALLPSRPEWGEHRSAAMQINTQGDIVGMVMSAADEPGFTDVDRVRIVRWGRDGTILDLPSPVADSFHYAGPHISDAGDVYATISTTSAGPYRIVRWQSGVPEIVLPSPGLPDASVIDVSRSGYLLAGNPFQLFEVRGPDGSWTTLQLPSSSAGIGVRGLTEDGGALGMVAYPDGAQRGARWNASGTVDVDSLPEGLTRFSYLARNGGGTLVGEGCAVSGCSFYVLDRGSPIALPVPTFPGEAGSFEHAIFRGLSDTDLAIGWFADATLQIFSSVRWRLHLTAPENLPPTADAGASYAGTEGTPIQFTGSAHDATPTGTLAASWSFGDGATANGLTPAHAFADNGNSVAVFRVADGEFAAEDSASVVVANVAPQVTTGPGTVLTAGGAHAVQAAFTDPGVLDAPWTYIVSWGDGSRNASGSSATPGALNLTHTYKQAGSYRVSITVTDKDGGLGSGEYPVTITKRGGHS